jgi:hypothetical protein
MKSVITEGQTIAGFAYAYKKHPNAPERVLMETFARTQGKAKVKIKNHSKFKYNPNLENYRLFSVHLKVMRELDMNLTLHDELGLPELDDDEEDVQPEVKKINGRIVLEDAFDFKNPVVLRRKK